MIENGNDDILLRVATEADLEAVVDIERASFQEPPWSWRSFASLFDDPYARFTVACDARAGTVTGYIVTWIIVEDAEIANLAVAPDWRARGVGGRLLDAAVAEAVTSGVRRLHLEVRESNRAAQLLYGSRGFVAVGRRKNYYRSPVEDALLFSRIVRDDGGADSQVMGAP